MRELGGKSFTVTPVLTFYPLFLRIFKFLTSFQGKLLGVAIELNDFNLHRLIEMDPPRDLSKSDVDSFVDLSFAYAQIVTK